MPNIKYIASLLIALHFFGSAPAAAQMTIEIKDYVTMPMTGLPDGKGNNEVLLSRVNGIREEPGGANRFFVPDLNGPLYILDKDTKKLTTYLDFNGREGHPGLFHKLFVETGYGSGLNGFYFDPDYRRNGKFYTVHIENPALPGSIMPDNANFRGLNLSGYTTTSAIAPPGETQFEGVLIEWTDTNSSNTTFEGTARELLRVRMNTRLHPIGDMIFNPTVQSGDPDWRVMYLECGDGGSGEAMSSIRPNPQRLDNFEGKILRIIPDLNEHTSMSTVSEQWRTYTVPAPGEPGSETWPKGDQWKTGGAPVWVTGNYDPDTNLAFWGTGNGGPTVGDKRPGDNLYTASTLALDVSTGELKGYHQYHPNDSWDYDEVSPPLLIDYRRGGRTIKGLIDVARDGYLWFLERSDGPIRFIEAKPYVYQNVFRSLDPETGRPEIDPANKPGTGKRADYCPGTHGGKNWPPIAFSPKTRMIYIPANNNMCSSNMGVEVQYTPGKAFVGVGGSQPFTVPGADHFGEVQAWNVDTGQRVWTYNYPKSPNWGSMLATGGGLVFSGGTNDRRIHAFDASTGKLLWEFPTNSGILAPPTSFAIDGKQYIAVLSGWGGDSRGDQNTLNRLFPGEYPEVPEGGAVWVFSAD